MQIESASKVENLPKHLAIIMDGNGRWAKARGLAREAGHRAGANSVRLVVSECRKLQIPYLTLYAFSSENWQRPKEEISALFSLLVEFLAKETPNIQKEGICLKVLGDIEALPLVSRTAIKQAMNLTKANQNMTLTLALNYGARAELVRAVRSCINAGLNPEAITEKTLAEYLYTKDQPDPDLLIRTGGELRLSNFLLYQCAYSELYFTPTLWPDFDLVALQAAFVAYSSRSRRFGKIEEQLSV